MIGSELFPAQSWDTCLPMIFGMWKAIRLDIISSHVHIIIIESKAWHPPKPFHPLPFQLACIKVPWLPLAPRLSPPLAPNYVPFEERNHFINFHGLDQRRQFHLFAIRLKIIQGQLHCPGLFNIFNSSRNIRALSTRSPYYFNNFRSLCANGSPYCQAMRFFNNLETIVPIENKLRDFFKKIILN